MAVTTGALGSSASNATNLYNVLATLLTANAHWTQTSDSPLNVTDSGLTGASTYVWKCDEGADFYVAFEVDDTNDRIRIRAAEAYDTVAHDPNQGASLHSTSLTITDADGVTPTANATVFDVAKVNWAGVVWYGQVNVPDAGLPIYLLEVRDHLVTIATNTGAQNYYTIVGQMESLVTAIPDDNPLCVFDHPVHSLASTGALAGGAAALGMASRSPGRGSVATTGAFALQINGLHSPAWYNATTVPSNADPYGGILPATAHRYFAGALASQAVVHGSQANAIASRRAYRGWLPGFLCTMWAASSGTEPQLGQTLSVDGVLYYFLGVCAGASGTTLLDDRSQLLLIKAT